MAIETYDYKPLCANCQNPGAAACTNCRLVTYCGKQCQTSHWQTHRSDCKSIRRAESWQPGWAIENRRLEMLPGYGSKPNQVQEVIADVSLWGSMPALDVLNPRNNEGESFSEDIKLLFAACGDPRNVIKTLAALPWSYNGTVKVTINDHHALVITRNVVICILAANIDDAEQASECITHIWYSAFVRQRDLDLLHAHVLPFAEEVCAKIADKSPASLHSEIVRLRKCSLCLVLSKEKLRLAAINNPYHRDHRDLGTARKSPAHRVSKQMFQDDGIILPFGHSRKEFVSPNLTFWQAGNWPLTYHEDPFHSWSLANIFRTPCGNAINDLTGKLYCHVRSHLLGFHQYLSEKGASFEFFSVDITELPDFLPKSAFTRIEVSNACDMAYLGPERTISAFAPLLQRSSVNPHATLLTAFLAAVNEVQNNRPPSVAEQEKFKTFALARLCQYQCILKLLRKPEVFDPMISAALPHVQDHESFLERYCEIFGFQKLAVNNRLRIKANHTIVEKRPLALKLKKGDSGFEDEFAMLLASRHRGSETYVEWASLD